MILTRQNLQKKKDKIEKLGKQLKKDKFQKLKIKSRTKKD